MNVLTEAVPERELPPCFLVTDNAANMGVAAQEVDSEIHIGCFVHTLYLACGKAWKNSSVSKLIARMRRIVDFLHCCSTAASMQKEKQHQLINKLIIDVQTRWTSGVDNDSQISGTTPSHIRHNC